MSLPPSATNKRKRGATATKVKAKEAKTAKPTVDMLLAAADFYISLATCLWWTDGGQYGVQNGYHPGPQYSSRYGGHYPVEYHPERKTQKYSDTLIEVRRGET
jgi:hypothetical protein